MMDDTATTELTRIIVVGSITVLIEIALIAIKAEGARTNDIDHPGNRPELWYAKTALFMIVGGIIGTKAWTTQESSLWMATSLCIIPVASGIAVSRINSKYQQLRKRRE